MELKVEIQEVLKATQNQRNALADQCAAMEALIVELRKKIEDAEQEPKE